MARGRHRASVGRRAVCLWHLPRASEVMGSNIARSASVTRIKDSGEKTMTAATARGGEVLELAQKRVAPVMAMLAACEQQLKEACTEDDIKHAALMARDNESDLEIGAVCDEIRNVMGRPRQSIDYDLIVNGGMSGWTDGDPAKQAAMMSLLAQNIRGSDHPKLAGKKEDWAKRIEAKAAAQAEAAKPALASSGVWLGTRPNGKAAALNRATSSG